jgi:hypothetical protein
MSAQWAAVPETAIHEDGNLATWKDEIRIANEAQGMNLPANNS